MHLALTGSAGFIGQEFLNSIHKEKKIKKITLIVNKKNPKIKKKFNKINFVHLDLRKKVENVKFNFKIDTMVHFGEYSRPYIMINVYKHNIKIFDNVIKILNLTKCKKLIYISSTEAVGPNIKKNKLVESSICRPITDYGRSKLRNEIKLKKIKKMNFKYIILRPTTIYGPNSIEFYKFFKLNNIGLFPFRSNKKCIEYFYLEDLITIIKKLVFKNIKNQTYNISPSKLLSINEILRIVSMVTKKKMAKFFFN